MSKRIPPDEPPFAWQRLYELIDALRSGVKLTGEMREEIALALEYLDGEVFAFHLGESMRRPGRPRSLELAFAAGLVHALVENYGAQVKAAACAVLPLGDAKGVEALEKHYRKMKRERQFMAQRYPDRVAINPDMLAEIAARLPRKVRKSGNK